MARGLRGEGLVAIVGVFVRVGVAALSAVRVRVLLAAEYVLDTFLDLPKDIHAGGTRGSAHGNE